MSETHKIEKLPENKRVIFLGRGRLTWARSERMSDRYGFVYLLARGDSTTPDYELSELSAPKDGKGTLVARVTEARESTHIGDLFRSLYPRTPKDGDIFVLGTGAPVTIKYDAITAIGVAPEDGRENDWLNPRALYDCHESVVELLWLPY